MVLLNHRILYSQKYVFFALANWAGETDLSRHSKRLGHISLHGQWFQAVASELEKIVVFILTFGDANADLSII